MELHLVDLKGKNTSPFPIPCENANSGRNPPFSRLPHKLLELCIFILQFFPSFLTSRKLSESAASFRVCIAYLGPCEIARLLLVICLLLVRIVIRSNYPPLDTSRQRLTQSTNNSEENDNFCILNERKCTQTYDYGVSSSTVNGRFALDFSVC